MVSSNYKKHLPMNPTERDRMRFELLNALDSMFSCYIARFGEFVEEPKTIYVPICNEVKQ